MVQAYVLLTLFCSFLHGASAVLCKYALQHSGDLRALSTIKKIIAVLSNRTWLLGIFLGVCANILVVQIQSEIDISIVYPILNFAYIFTLLLGFVFLKENLTRPQWLGVIAVTVGTATILLVKNPSTGGLTDMAALKWTTLLAMASAMGLLLVGSRSIQSKNLNYEIVFALCAGVCFGSVETYLKTTTNLVASELGRFSVISLDSIVAFVTVWPFFVLALFSAVGFVSLQLAFSRGHVSVTVPLIAVTQRMINMISGYFVFGEAFPLTKIIGFLTIILGAMIMVLSSIKRGESEAVLRRKFS
ncbi:MAG: EamA family transporter [Gammaproteobacteria bacterium]